MIGPICLRPEDSFTLDLLESQRNKRHVALSRPGWDIINSPIGKELGPRSYDDLFFPIFPPLIDSFINLVDDYVVSHNEQPPLWLELMGTLQLLVDLEVPGVAVGLERDRYQPDKIQLKSDLLDCQRTFSKIRSALANICPTYPYPTFITWKGEGGLMGIPQTPKCFAFYISLFSSLLDYGGSGYYQVPGILLSQTRENLTYFCNTGTGFFMTSARANKNYKPYDGLIRIDRHAIHLN